MRTTTVILPLVLLGAALEFSHPMPLGAAAPNEPCKILVFTKTAGFRHESITNGLQVIRQLGTNNQFEVVATEDATYFNDETLEQFRAVVFLLNTGDVLNEIQQGAFERYIRAGNGFVGIHSVADAEYDWAWYGELLGARYSSHPAIQNAFVVVEDDNHPSTSFLPERWLRNDEWFNYSANPRTNVQVLCRVDETSYSGGTMGDHPIAWCHEFDGGRAWYTGLGHNPGVYSDAAFQAHLLGGIRYAAALNTPPPNALVLFDGTDNSHWIGANGRPGVPWQIVNGELVVAVGSNYIQTFQTFQDYRLHLEFLVPPSPSGTPEGALANSGVFLQGLYEVQILESFGRPVTGFNETGAIWGQRDPSTNASRPAGTWESFDIVFRGGQWEGGTKIANARVSVWWNGVLVQNDVELPRPTANANDPDQPPPGPILLQDYGSGGAVRFRNIWLEPLDAVPQGKVVKLIPPGSAWRYQDNGLDQPVAWRELGYDDTTWKIGPAQLGYGNNGEVTVINGTSTTGSRIITTWFRKEFTATDVWSITNLTCRMVCDDGAVVYLNGVEVLRNNMPSTAVNYLTPASIAVGGAAETNWVGGTISAAMLREGANCLAVELHQTASTSDAGFDLALSGVRYKAPKLDLRTGGTNVVVAWPALPGGFGLEAGTDLGAANGWQSVTNVASLSTNKESKVTLPAVPQNKFYRLRR